MSILNSVVSVASALSMAFAGFGLASAEEAAPVTEPAASISFIDEDAAPTVTSGSTIDYRLHLDVQAAPERAVDVSFTVPDALEWPAEDHGLFADLHPIAAERTDNTVHLTIPADTALAEDRTLTLRARDGLTEPAPDQVLSATVALAGSEPGEPIHAAPVTVEPVPAPEPEPAPGPEPAPAAEATPEPAPAPEVAEPEPGPAPVPEPAPAPAPEPTPEAAPVPAPAPAVAPETTDKAESADQDDVELLAEAPKATAKQEALAPALVNRMKATPFSLQSLAATGTIRGLVWADSTGDGTGAGMAGYLYGATIQLLRDGKPLNPDVSASPEIGTGIFEFSDLPVAHLDADGKTVPYTYKVKVVPPKATQANYVYWPSDRGQYCHIDANGLSDPVTLTSGGTSMIYAGFQEVPNPTVSGVVFNDKNNNGTQDAGEAGIGGVVMNIADQSGDYVNDEAGDGNPMTVTTAADGSYRFDHGLANPDYAGKFRVLAAAPAMVPQDPVAGTPAILFSAGQTPVKPTVAGDNPGFNVGIGQKTANVEVTINDGSLKPVEVAPNDFNYPAQTVTLTVRNTGELPLTGLKLAHDDFGAGVTGLTCDAADPTVLATGATMKCTGTLTYTGSGETKGLSQEVTATATFGNQTATVGGTGSYSYKFLQPESVPQVVIEKTLNKIEVGGKMVDDVRWELKDGVQTQIVTWRYHVQNTGKGVAYNVHITDDRGVEVKCPRTTLDFKDSSHPIPETYEMTCFGSAPATMPAGS